MEGQAILALLAVFAAGMATGGALVSQAIRALSGAPVASVTPLHIPPIDPAVVAKVTADIQALITLLNKRVP